MRHRIDLSRGDVSSFVYDDKTKRLEIYNADSDEDPLVQAQMSETERSRLILALRSADGKTPE